MPQAKGVRKRQAPKQETNLAKRPKRKHLDKLTNDIIKSIVNYDDLIDAEQELSKGLGEAKKKIKELQDQVNQLDKENKFSARKVNRLERENGGLRVDLLRKQPENQKPDYYIVEMYKRLRISISSWVDDELPFAARDEGFKTQTTSPRASPDDANFLAKSYTYGLEYLLESLIMTQLHERLYGDNVICFGLSGADDSFLRIAEQALTEIDPPRDVTAIRYLRSELLKGYITTRQFDALRKEELESTTDKVLRVVETVLEGSQDNPGRKSRFNERVMQPAVELAILMNSSATKYSFSDSMSDKSRFKEVPLSARALDSCVVIDVDTRTIVRADMVAVESKDDIIGTQVILLAPGLRRCYPAGASTRKLCSKVAAVKLSNPLLYGPAFNIGNKEQTSDNDHDSASEVSDRSESGLDASYEEVREPSCATASVVPRETRAQKTARSVDRSALDVQKKADIFTGGGPKAKVNSEEVMEISNSQFWGLQRVPGHPGKNLPTEETGDDHGQIDKWVEGVTKRAR
ncbi:MAG: hypothetical protein Q9219_006639 [cf. Caloplaca sp. 3 TL-2023]